MNDVPTPINLIDGHTDLTRPDGAAATLIIQGAPQLCTWSSQFRLWLPQSNVTIQPSTPLSSPPSLSTVPIFATQIAPQPTMGPRLNVAEPTPTLSAKMYLDLLPPPITVNQLESPRPSSTVNLNYANIEPITGRDVKWSIPGSFGDSRSIGID